MSTRLACRLSLALFVVTLVVFLPVVSHGFCPCRLCPDVAEYHFNLATALRHCGESAECDAAAADGLRLDPAWPRKAQRMAQALTGCPPEAALRSEQAQLAR